MIEDSLVEDFIEEIYAQIKKTVVHIFLISYIPNLCLKLLAPYH